MQHWWQDFFGKRQIIGISRKKLSSYKQARCHGGDEWKKGFGPAGPNLYIGSRQKNSNAEPVNPINTRIRKYIILPGANVSCIATNRIEVLLELVPVCGSINPRPDIIIIIIIIFY